MKVKLVKVEEEQKSILAALHKVVIWKPNLGERILARMDEMVLSKYKDSMASLIRKDMEALARKITEKQGEISHGNGETDTRKSGTGTHLLRNLRQHRSAGSFEKSLAL